MINLTDAKIGDKFVLRNGYMAQLVASKPAHGIYVLDLIGDISYVICMSNGMCIIQDPYVGTNKQLMRHLDVTFKHDSRPWLKDLPSADLFCEKIIDIKHSSDGKWEFTYREEQEYRPWSYVQGIKMPTLTGDQWKDSKISIPELKAWQLANKEQS